MKSINKIFETNKSLMDEPEVEELIEYCRELESDIIESKQLKQFSFEDKLTSLVIEIYDGIKEVENQQKEYDRWGDDSTFSEPDYRKCVENLGNYLRDFSKNNKFRL